MDGARVVCPKCGHRPPRPIGAMEACPACGVYMHKWAHLQHAPALAARTTNFRRDADRGEEECPGAERWPQRLLTLADTSPAEILVRAIVLGLLGLWGLYLASRDLASGEIGESFMHSILLPIHEAGHVVMIPFGEFLTVAGGSFWQVALPLAIGIAFLVRHRDPFGAAVCLWWAGISLMDLAPYIYDALHPQLMLLGGSTGEDGPHDWIYLFGRLGGLHYAQGWGRFAHAVGVFVSSAAVAWGGVLLWRTHRTLTGSRADA